MVLKFRRKKKSTFFNSSFANYSNDFFFLCSIIPKKLSSDRTVLAFEVDGIALPHPTGSSQRRYSAPEHCFCMCLAMLPPEEKGTAEKYLLSLTHRRWGFSLGFTPPNFIKYTATVSADWLARQISANETLDKMRGFPTPQSANQRSGLQQCLHFVLHIL